MSKTVIVLEFDGEFGPDNPALTERLASVIAMLRASRQADDAHIAVGPWAAAIMDVFDRARAVPGQYTTWQDLDR